jgi:hypothetical protein
MGQYFEGLGAIQPSALVLNVVDKLRILVRTKGNINLYTKRVYTLAGADIIASVKKVSLVHIGRISGENI